MGVKLQGKEGKNEKWEGEGPRDRGEIQARSQIGTKWEEKRGRVKAEGGMKRGAEHYSPPQMAIF